MASMLSWPTRATRPPAHWLCCLLPVLALACSDARESECSRYQRSVERLRATLTPEQARQLAVIERENRANIDRLLDSDRAQAQRLCRQLSADYDNRRRSQQLAPTPDRSSAVGVPACDRLLDRRRRQPGASASDLAARARQYRNLARAQPYEAAEHCRKLLEQTPTPPPASRSP